jgi:hypothetical protein
LRGVRLRDLCAGPARTTCHGFFSSAEFIKGHVVTTFVRGSAASNSAQFGRRGSFLRELPKGHIGAECFPDELRPGPILRQHGSLHLLSHRGGKRNGNGLPCSHGCYLLTPCLTSITEETAVSTPISRGKVTQVLLPVSGVGAFHAHYLHRTQAGVPVSRNPEPATDGARWRSGVAPPLLAVCWLAHGGHRPAAPSTATRL